MKHYIVAAFALAAVSLAAAPALAKTIAVKPGDSIQAAVDAANPGDKILLKRGVHNEEVDVNGKANLKFAGQRGAIWDGYNDTTDAHFDILDINDSNGVVVQNITFRNGSIQIDIDSNSTSCKVMRCRSRAADSNFVECDSDGFRGERNNITGSQSEPFDLDADDLVVRLNRMRYCGEGGIELDGDDALVERNFMANMEDGPGIDMEDCDDSTVQRNTLMWIGGDGIEHDGDNAMILNNRIMHLGEGFGVEVESSDKPTVRGNTVIGQSDDEDAFYVDANGTAATVENNRVSDCQEGGFVIDTSNGGTIRNNRVNNYGNEDDDAAFDITGNDNTITNCNASNGFNDAFVIDGNGNTLTRCSARNIDEDGIVIEGIGSTGNTIDRCTITDCAAEGLQNEGTNTVVRNSRFLKSRLDVTNSGTFATFSGAGNKFTTGGETTLPEID